MGEYNRDNYTLRPEVKSKIDNKLKSDERPITVSFPLEQLPEPEPEQIFNEYKAQGYTVEKSFFDGDWYFTFHNKI
jgi:hypothetical protein